MIAVLYLVPISRRCHRVAFFFRYYEKRQRRLKGLKVGGIEEESEIVEFNDLKGMQVCLVLDKVVVRSTDF